MLLGVTCGTVAFVSDAHAEREITFYEYVLKTPPPAGCRDYPDPLHAAIPCSDAIPGKKFSGGCTYYDWGEDEATFDRNTKTFQKMSFPANTIVTPALYRKLGNLGPKDELPGSMQVDSVDKNGVVTVVTISLFKPGSTMPGVLPAGVVIPERTPYSGVTNRLVTCVRMTLMNTIATKQAKLLAEPMANITLLLAAIAIALYGYEVVLNKQGARKPYTLIARSALIVGVISFSSANGVKEYMDFFITGQEELANVVSSHVKVTVKTSTDPNATFTAMCGRSEKKYKTGGPQVPDPDNAGAMIDAEESRVYSTWERVDCIMASMLGMRVLKKDGKREDFGDLALDAFDISSIGKDEALVLMPAALFLGLLWTSYGGWIILIGGFVVFTMIAAFAHAVLVYVVSMVVVVFLSVIGPIVVPMALFESTRHGFLLWLQMLFAYMLQPAMVMAYLTFMMIIIDSTVYGRPPLTDNEQTRKEQLLDDQAHSAITPAGIKELEALAFPKSGSLMWYYNKVAMADLKSFPQKALLNMKGLTQSVNVSQGGNNQTATAGNEKGGITAFLYEFLPGGANARAANESEMYRLVQSLLTAALLFGLTYTFLVTIMARGVQIAGLEANSKMLALNAFSAMSEKLKTNMRGSMSR